MEPFNAKLNQAVLVISRRLLPLGFQTEPSLAAAPSNLNELRRCVKQYGRIVVWSGGSEVTTFGDPDINIMFRAWHDHVHLSLGAEMDLEGETRVARAMVDQVRAAFGEDFARDVAPLLYTEIVGQTLYCACHDAFPPDQRAFARRMLDALAAPGEAWRR